MANVVKKHSISLELAQKMVNAAVAKAREIGVSENVAILDDGANLKAFSRMDGASIPTIEIAQNKAYTALFGVSTQDFFNFIQGDPSLLAGIPTLARVAAWGGGFPIKVDGEIVGAIGVSGAPTVQNDVDCAKAALALVSDVACGLNNPRRRIHGWKEPPWRIRQPNRSSIIMSTYTATTVPTQFVEANGIRFAYRLSALGDYSGAVFHQIKHKVAPHSKAGPFSARLLECLAQALGADIPLHHQDLKKHGLPL